jgi:origin recognition complex subunit 1
VSPEPVAWQSHADARKVAKLLQRPTGRFSKVFESLNEAHAVPQLLFRQSEKEQIRQFVTEAHLSGGANAALYITGLPGLGKTACAMEVLAGLEQRLELAPIYLNALRLNTPAKFYNQLWVHLSGNQSSKAEACQQLAGYFSQRKQSGDFRYSQKQLKVLVIDEVDYLLSRKQDVLYNLFDWMHAPQARLCIICISNTLDLMNKLIGKIRSRVGNNVLIFRPYSSSEVLEILRLRLGANSPAGEERCVFSKDALTFIAKKVANFTSDIRKSFEICRRTLHEFLLRGNRRDKITVELVSQVISRDANRPLFNYLSNCSELVHVLVVALLVLKAINQTTVVRSEVVFGRVNTILKQKHRPELTFQQFRLLVSRVAGVALIGVREAHKSLFDIVLTADSDEVSYALRENPDFLRFGPMIEAQNQGR